jgi:multiple sugar transport system substrate-binding protein
MGKVKWLVGVVVVLLVMAGPLWGAGQPQTATTGPAKLSVLTSTGILEQAIKLTVTEYQKLHPDVSVEIVPLPDPGFTQKFLQSFAAGATPFDIAEIHTGLLAVAVANRWVIPLDALIQKNNLDMKKEYMQSYIDNVTLDGKAKISNPAGEIYGLPTHGDLYMYVYRKDLYEANGLALPKTWEEFVTNNQKLTKPAEDFYGLVLSGRTSADSHLGSDFFQLAINMNGTLAFKEGATAGSLVPNIYSPGNIQAAEFYRDLINKYKVMPPGVKEYSYTEKNIAIAQGRAGGMFQWVFGSTATTEDPTRSKVVGKLGYGMPPGGKGVGGGWEMTITRDAKNPDLAFDFMRFRSINMDPQIVVNTASGAVTTSFARDPAVLAKYPYAQDYAAGALNGVHTSGIPPAFPGWPQVNDALRSALGTVLYDGVSGDAAFKKLNADLAVIVKNVTGQ